MRDTSSTGELLCEVIRRQAEEDAEGIDGLTSLDFETRYRRLRVFQQRGRLLNVELRSAARLETHAGDPEAVLLYAYDVSGDGQTLVEHPDTHVGGGDLPDEANQHVIVAGHGGEQIGVCSLDRTTEFAPEIELPDGVEPGPPGIQGPRPDRAEWRILAALVTGITADQLLLLWKQVPDCDRASRLRLEDAETGGAQRKFLLVR